jgi:exopolysaccharide biosynthesis operon protein EpsL
MKKASIRPLLTVTAAAFLLPGAAAVHAQTTLQSPGGLGQSAAQPAGQPAGEMAVTPMGQSMAVPMSPAASISQPFAPVSSAVAAGEREGFQLRAIAGVERDSNVLRVDTGKQSDTITQLGVGLRFNKRYGLQRVVLDVEADRFDFDKLNTNYNTLNYAAAWNWAVGNKFDGIVSADRRQFRDVTTNGTLTTVNRRTERNELVEGGYRLGAAWRVLAGLEHNSARSTDPNSWDGNPDVNSVRVGTSYELGSGTSITARYRHGDGEYKNAPINADFKDNEIEAVVHWPVTAKTSLDGRLAHLKREHDAAPSRDFSGTLGSLAATWEATAKTRLVVGYARDLGSYLFGTGGHVSSDRYYIAPVWRATAATAVSLRYEHENRKWDDVTGSTDAGRRDRYNVLAAGVDWQVRRTVALSAQVRNERRSSSLPAFNYRANVIGLSAKLTI